ncbi:MAG: hypothetical protein GX139_07440 [Armatimonadetes bacterium]|jgi:SAM-dependent methyltransferase|nr:hypothetical protein [Armatimonadota bacterium]
MQSSDRWKSTIEWWASKRAGCVVEWDTENPEWLFMSLADQYASSARRVLQVGCCSEDTDCQTTDGSTWIKAKSASDVDDTFDLICSCAGLPVIEQLDRVLAADGLVVGITTSRLHYIETQEIFRRTPEWMPPQCSIKAISHAIENSSFEILMTPEYFGASYCPDVDDFTKLLETSAIAADFDASKDAELIKDIHRKLMHERGIRNTEHHVIYMLARRS